MAAQNSWVGGKQPHVLILGAGLVSPPIIEYLAAHGIKQTVASRTLAKTQNLIKDLKDAQAVEFDIEQPNALEALDQLTQQVDLVVSLLPYIHHVPAAKIALKYGKHFCTTSYVSADMEKLGAEALEKGVILLNECGVDPGLDHMSAQKIIDEVHAKGGKIVSFYSICGGLPAPQHNNNPLGYKLSWSPRGVLLAGRNDAIFLRQGEKVQVPGRQLYEESVYRVDDFGNEQGVGKLEWYPNRDSVKYADIYGIPEVKTIVRGTYRNQGWCRYMKSIATLALNSTDVLPVGGKKFADFTADYLALPGPRDTASLRAELAKKLALPTEHEVLHKFEWLGLFSSELTVPEKVNTPLDALCFLFERSLQYAPGEKDLLVMKHTFEVEYSPSVRETITSTMIDFGQQPEGHSSMSRTVTLPVAVAIRAILDGRMKTRGLVRPVLPEVYNLILAEMETLGVKFQEKVLGTQLWLRSEVKPGEERVALVPSDVSKLIQDGFRVTVEQSPHRCISDDEYAKVGAQLVPTGTWPSAPYPAIIVGLKELPESKDPLVHRHVFFAHCYKQQGGWKEILHRFVEGKGLLWDLEFLVDDQGRRVAAFGRPAGIAGMAVGLIAWAAQQSGEPCPKPLKSWKTSQAMIDDVKGYLARAEQATQKKPSVLVLGALGRCGKGAVWLAHQCGVQPVEWDLEETKKGGPFPELLQHDVLVNCIYLSGKIPPFITPEMLQQTRKLTMVVDVSCDTSNPNNPLPFYNQNTTLFEPTLRVVNQPPLDVVAIDHLPSLVPYESSDAFSHDLLPSVHHLKHPKDHPVWARAEKLFNEKVAQSQQ